MHLKCSLHSMASEIDRFCPASVRGVILEQISSSSAGKHKGCCETLTINSEIVAICNRDVFAMRPSLSQYLENNACKASRSSAGTKSSCFSEDSCSRASRLGAKEQTCLSGMAALTAWLLDSICLFETKVAVFGPFRNEDTGKANRQIRMPIKVDRDKFCVLAVFLWLLLLRLCILCNDSASLLVFSASLQAPEHDG